MIIRQEQNKDYKKVYEVVKKAFESAQHSDGSEQDLVERLRKSEAFIPELSLVAIINYQIVGHIMFTKIEIGNEIGITLAPLAVLPEFQGMGIGSALIRQAHKIAKELGFKVSVVLGSEKYYPKFGYIPAKNFEITSPMEDVPSENFMAINLTDSSISIKGEIKYAKEFFE